MRPHQLMLLYRKTMHRLLLVSCSSTKSVTPGTLPAINRYEGVIFKVIKKAKREGYWPENTSIYIVSAKYGLISEHTPIEFYDQKMTPTRARELQPLVSKAIDELLTSSPYQEIFLNLGEIYRESISASREIEYACLAGRLQEASGGIGIRQQQTKTWILNHAQLDQEPPRIE